MKTPSFITLPAPILLSSPIYFFFCLNYKFFFFWKSNLTLTLEKIVTFDSNEIEG